MAGFVDEAQVHVKAGNRGAGAVGFRREAHVSRGGPDGGNGGNGGDVYLEATTDAVSLLAFADHPHRRAGDATHGAGGKRHGKNGTDLIVPVPVGTIVRDATGAVLEDLALSGERLLAARGGRGGRGNTHFASNRLRAPAFAEQGEVGEERWLDLELKLMADVALVGFPNAGKSTLIATISAARPKIAPYPFTTLEPHLGVVRYPPGASRRDDGPEIVVADVPGLIEGAHLDKGLGHRFLRHIERARVLVFLIDLAADAERRPDEQLATLRFELAEHEPELAARPSVVVGSRADLISPDERPERGAYGGALEISAVTHEGLDELVGLLVGLVGEERERAAEAARTTSVIHRLVPDDVLVTKEANTFVVEGREARWAVALSDLNDPDALALAHRRLERIGVNRALSRAGAHDGDTVRIGSLEFTFEGSR